MNNKAFTLIELLVVVAIIGILAAVGVVAYNGYTGAAKVNATKSNRKTIEKYINLELTKCELGETTVMDGNLNCADITKFNEVSNKTYKALANVIKNPYGGADPGIGYGQTNQCKYSIQIGITYVYNAVPNNKLKIMTCYKINDPPVLTTLTIY